MPTRSYPIACVPSSEIIELRTKILRPGQWPRGEKYTQDNFDTTHHFRAVDEERCVGVATFILHQPCQDFDIPIFAKPGAIQLRGMAVHADYRRLGIGKDLIQYAKKFLSSEFSPDSLLWFNARENAIPFYAALGFNCIGNFFDVPHIGPHKIMWRPLGPV